MITQTELERVVQSTIPDGDLFYRLGNSAFIEKWAFGLSIPRFDGHHFRKTLGNSKRARTIKAFYRFKLSKYCNAYQELVAQIEAPYQAEIAAIPKPKDFERLFLDYLHDDDIGKTMPKRLQRYFGKVDPISDRSDRAARKFAKRFRSFVQPVLAEYAEAATEAFEKAGETQ